MRPCCIIYNFIWLARRNDHLSTEFNVDDLIVNGESRNNSGEPSHTINLTNQATETMDI